MLDSLASTRFCRVTRVCFVVYIIDDVVFRRVYFPDAAEGAMDYSMFLV
jgi:hypothetical protein